MVAAPQLLPDPPPAPVPGREVLPIATGTYLAGVARGLEAGLRLLPATADEVQRDFGAEFYDQVALDPQVKAALRILLTAALNRGVQLGIPTPRTDPQYERGSKYAAFVRAAFDRLPRTPRSLLYEMGTAALTHGHSLSEAVWTTAKILPNYGPQLIYAAIKPKPLTVYRFVQDVYGNVPGLIRNSGPVVRGTLTGGALNGEPVYPLDAFPVLTWDATHGDPRGHSLLRVIYADWWDKQQTRPGLLAYLARFGQPSLKMVMPPGAPDKVTVGGMEYETRALYRQTGEDYQAGGVVVIPNGAEAALQEASGNGDAYINAHKLWNRAISVGLTGQTLATGEGDSRSGTDSRTHQDMLGLFVTFIKDWLADFVNQSLIRPLIRANFGESGLPYAPVADLGRIAPEDMMALLQAFAQLGGPGNYWNAAVVPPDIGAKLDQMSGMPERQTTAVGPTGAPADVPPTNPNPPQATPPQEGPP